MEGLGDAGGMGMSGTGSKGSVKSLLSTIKKIMEVPYELVDIGAGSSSFLVAGFAFGAERAVGIELKNSGQESIFSSFRLMLERDYGVPKCSFHVTYGVDVSKCTSLDSFSPPGPACCSLPKAVFSFCDGFSEADREHMFHLVASDKVVCLFLACCGRGKGDAFQYPEDIVLALNKVEAFEKFSHHGVVRVRMFGNCKEEKQVHVFRRAKKLI